MRIAFVRFGIGFLLSLTAFAPLGKADDAPEKSITIEELEVLAAKKAYGEMLLHLDEIPSGERNAKWEELVARAVAGHLKQLAGDEGGAEVLALQTEEKFPFLQRSPTYLTARNEAGMRSIERCYAAYKMAAECTQRLINFVEAPPRSPELAYVAAQLVVKRHSAAEALPLFAVALTEKSKATVCKGEGLARAALDAMEHGPGNLREIAIDLVQNSCWEQMRGKFEKKLAKERNPAFLDVACPIAKGKADEKMPAYCASHLSSAPATVEGSPPPAAAGSEP